MSDLAGQLAAMLSTRCGDCGKLFEDVAGDVVYMRQRPARLICLDCKGREELPEVTK